MAVAPEQLTSPVSLPSRSPSPQQHPPLAVTSGRAPGLGFPPGDELRELCTGLLKALDDERKAASAKATGLGLGTRVRIDGTGTHYRFPTAMSVDASDGDPVVLRVGQRELEGHLTAVDERHIDITLEDDLGPTVSSGAELLLEAPWLIERLRESVRKAFTGGLETDRIFNLAGALRTLGIGEIPVALTGLSPEYENGARPLNEEQARAISIAFRSPLSVIAAPAGTGKTLTIGALVEACYRAKLRTLVTAPSNVAVDQQMLQICARLEGEQGFQDAEVLRAGSDVDTALRGAYGDAVVLDRVVARLFPTLRERIARLQNRVDALAAQLHAARSAPDVPDASRLQASLAAARAELRVAQSEAREYGRRLSDEARVVGATLAHVFLSQEMYQFDVVVIDEASMAQLPAVFLAAGQARRHVVIAGDPFQLAAPLRTSGPASAWLARDVFHRLDVVRAIRDEEDVPYMTQLTEQRRSAKGICTMLGDVWYGPSLRTAPEVLRRERAWQNNLFSGSSLCYIDTAPLRARAYHPWGRTYANDEHAALIVDLVAYLDASGELPAADALPTVDEVSRASAGIGEVLVLSHYRGQIANLRRRLASYDSRGVAVRTVHRAQGAEARTCVFDLTLTASQPTRVSSVLTANSPEHEGSRLLAVAASRARSRFVFVGDLEWISRSVARNTVLRRLVEHLRENGTAIPIDELRPRHRVPRLQVVR